MGGHPLDSLTDRQRECLRLVARERGSGEIATILGISTETVESHIKRARSKLGGVTRFTAARTLADYEGRHQSLGTDELGIADWDPAIDTDLALPLRGEPVHTRLRDVRAEFDHTMPTPTPARKERLNALTALHRIGIVLAIAFLIALIIIAASPMSDSFQRFANLISAPQPK